VTHVLMTADTVGGVWTYALELVRGLAAHDVHVTLATMGAALSPAQARAARGLPNLDIVESTYALEWMADPWRDVDTASDWLLEIARRIEPDLVHVNGYAHAALPFGVPVVCVAHSCVVTWFRAVRGSEPGTEWDTYRTRVRNGLLAADEVVAPTAAILRDIMAAYRIPADGRVISNGRTVDPPRHEKQHLVLAAGRLWDEAKGISTLAAAAPMLSWPVCVAGPTTAPGATNTNVPADVQLLGELSADDMITAMARASIYALPARYEPFGLSVLEAALAGCALVLSDIATFRELWSGAAIFVEPGDDVGFARAVTALIADPAERARRGRLAQAAAARYTVEAMADAMLGVYRGLLPAQAGRAAA